MNKLDKFDMQFCINRLPKKLKDLMETPQWIGKVFIGGGFIRGVIAHEEINDVDLFVQSESDAAVLSGLLCERPSDLVKTDNAFTIKGKLPIQVIFRWVFNEPEDVSNSFDFTVCCAVIFNKIGWDSYCCDRFYIDLAAKRLVYRSPVRNEDAGGSMLRVLKYYQRGYRIPLDSLGAVIARLMKGVDYEKIDKADDREKQVAKVVTGLLREVDPNIDPTHNAHLSPIEELFQ